MIASRASFSIQHNEGDAAWVPHSGKHGRPGNRTVEPLQRQVPDRPRFQGELEHGQDWDDGGDPLAALLRSDQADTFADVRPAEPHGVAAAATPSLLEELLAEL